MTHHGGLGLEIRKRFTQPLAVESGEFPDVGAVEGRMLPICYDNALTNGHAPEAAKLLSLATETFIKEALASIFSRVRSNAPGEGGAASFGVGANWIRTHRYKRQLAKEEEAAMRGKITRDSSGFLPVEAKAASDRGPLSMTDLRIALSVADFGLAQFPAIRAGIINDYREGELESWASYSWLPGREPARATGREKQILARCSGPGNNSTAIATTITPVKSGSSNYMNGVGVDSAADAMEVDSDVFWHGAEAHDLLNLDSMLDSCLSSSTQPMWGV
jgi:transcriptional coactivator HFI1/ADA1